MDLDPDILVTFINMAVALTVVGMAILQQHTQYRQ